MKKYKRILMLGPSLEGRTGIAAMMETYAAHGLFRRWPVQYVATHCEGGIFAKLAMMLGALGAVVLALVRERRTVVHVHGASHASFWRKALFMAIAHVARCPVVYHLHGAALRDFYEKECGGADRWLIRFFLERAARVVVLSESARSWVASVCPSARLQCLSNPVTDIPLMPVPGRRGMILYVGRLERRKGLYDLIEAVSALRERLPEVTLVCAGEGDSEPFARFAEQVGVRDAVTFTGWLGNEQKRSLLQRAAVFVLPSYFEEMPMTVLEAMVARVPVVATAVGAIPDMIVDGTDGFLFRPGDVAALHRLISRLLHDADLAARITVEARRKVTSRYAAEHVLAQLGALYSGLGVSREDERAGPLPGRTPQEVT